MRPNKWDLLTVTKRAETAEARVAALELERAELTSGARVIVRAEMLKELTDEVSAREQHWQRVTAALRERIEAAEAVASLVTLERDDARTRLAGVRAELAEVRLELAATERPFRL